MTLFGTRKGLRKLLPMAVITSLVLTMTPMTSQADSVSPLQLLLEFAKLKKKKIAKCPCKPCCISGACCPSGTCCPAGGCCDQFKCCPLTGVCPLGSCPAIAPLACCAGQCAINDVLMKHGQAGQQVQIRVEKLNGTPVGAAQLHGVISHVVKQGNVVIVVHQGNAQSVPLQRTQITPIQQSHATAIWSGVTPAGVHIQPLLDRKITMGFQNVSLKDCVQEIRAYVGNLDICIDEKAVQQAGIHVDCPITAHCQDVSLSSALGQILKQANLTFKVENGAIKITTAKAVANSRSEPLETWTHNVSDVLGAISALQARQAVAEQIRCVSAVNVGGFGVVNSGNALRDLAASHVQACQTCKPDSCQRPEDILIDLIQKCVAPESWSDVGGTATIGYYPLGTALVVGQQSATNQNQIVCLLNVLRHLHSCGLICKPTGETACGRCPAAACDQCPASCERVMIRIVKPEQCGAMPFCFPMAFSSPDQCPGYQCVPACGPCDADIRAVFKKYADEMQRLCVDYQREVDELQGVVTSLKQELAAQRQARDLENCVRDLQQDLYNLRQEMHMSRFQQQTFAPPYHVQPVSMPTHPMSPTFFFMPAGSAGQNLPMPTTGGPVPFEFRIPR